MLPTALTQLLLRHRDRFAPVYPPACNSDHMPMALLAMHGLGWSMADITRFAQEYSVKLVPLETVASCGIVGATDRPAPGASYPALLQQFDQQIEQLGWERTVRHHLPALQSGCARDAFHPLIRLGYGIAFEVPSEIAAGLAYLAWLGPDADLARCARTAPLPVDGIDYLTAWRSLQDDAYEQGRFNARVAQVVACVPLRPALSNDAVPWRALTAASLQVFHATHDFFALHMVTASHAMRLCAPYAGAEGYAVGSVALAAAYLAIGAPACAEVDLPPAEFKPSRLRNATDEHDIKLAFSCMAHARVFDDPRYTAVAAAYLSMRR